MPRFPLTPGRVLLAALLLGLAQAAARADDEDDAKKAAAAAEKVRPELQKKLAGGTDLQKRLRLDKFEAAGGSVKVVGVFLDSPPTKADDPPPLKQVGEELEKLVGEQLKTANLKLDASGIKPIPPDQHPHVVVQLAANEAGAKGDPSADLAVFTGTEFTESGGVSVVGFRTKTGTPFGWMAKRTTGLLDKNPAYLRPNGTGAVAYNLKPVEWTVGPADLQKVLASAGKADGTPEEKDRVALRRLGVERSYFTYQIAKDDEGKATGAALRFRIEGVRLGEAEVKVEWAQDVIGPVVATVTGRPVPGDYGALVGTVIEEPVAALRKAVADRPALDGVRVDPGFTFGEKGELLPAGIQPGLAGKGEEELQSVVQSGFAAHGKGKPLAEKYGRVATRPVAAKAMAALPIRKVLAELRAWVLRNKDDLKVQRLYFPADIEALRRNYTVMAGGGLVLVYRPSNSADIKDVEDEFRRLLAANIEGGVPPAPGAPKDDGAPPPNLKDKEPLLPSMVAHLRAVLAGDQKKWNGVLIERGYFDEENRYVLVGVVDRREQVAELEKLLATLQNEPKWEEYFRVLPVRLEFTPIPMREMLERVQRVTPAYSAFDGVRIVGARYDASANLVFDAHVVGQLDRDAEALLARLLVDSPEYRRRLPPGRRVIVNPVEGPAYPDDQLANFSLAFGGKLLAKANPTKEDLQKAREWLDVATLHYPNEAAVWFLDAYYQFAVSKDEELARRDLYRVIELEGTLAFNGPAQRRRRYDAAKDIQGTTRTQLEDLWLECFRDVKDGAKPITLKK